MDYSKQGNRDLFNNIIKSGEKPAFIPKQPSEKKQTIEELVAQMDEFNKWCDLHHKPTVIQETEFGTIHYY